MISAVGFDAFGTLLNLKSKRHPFRQLLKEGIAAGRRHSPDDVRVLMSHPWTLQDAADHLVINVSPTRLQALQDDLDREVTSITPFADGLKAVGLLRAEGVRVGICPNLCEPYGASVLHAFPELDGYAFSYQIGAMNRTLRSITPSAMHCR
jgi:FMN phosphatase YigB (HAD superfamily)